MKKKLIPTYWPTYEQLVMNEERPDDEMCLTFIFMNQYSRQNGGWMFCPECGKVSLYRHMSKKRNTRSFECKNTGCRHTILPLQGTIFHYKKVGLSKIFHVIWLLTNDPETTSQKIVSEIDCVELTADALRYQILDVIT